MTESKPKVLVTGASGLLGGLAVKHLKHKYDFSALNRSRTADFSHTRTAPMDPSIPWTQADISDFDAMLPAFEGIDMVVHMANYTSDSDSWHDHLTAGMIGTRNVYEAARLAGASRVVFASTNHVIGYFPMKQDPYRAIYEGRLKDVRRPFPLLTDKDVRPDSYYGVSKAFGESLN